MCAGDSPYDLQFLGQYGPGRDQPQLQHTGGFGQYNEKVEKLAAADWDVYCPSDGRVSVPDSYEVTARKSRKVKDRKKKKRDRTKLYTIISDLDIDKGTRLSQVRCEHQATVDDVEKLGKYASRCGIFIDEENGGNRGIAVRRIADDGSLRNRPKHHKFEELRGKGPVFVAYLLKALSGQFELTYEKLVASLFPYSSPDDSGIKFGRAKIRVHQTIGNIARHSKKRTRTKKGSGRTSPKSVNGVLNGALNDYLVGESGVGYKLKENRPSFCYICPVDHEAAIPLTDILESENS